MGPMLAPWTLLSGKSYPTLSSARGLKTAWHPHVLGHLYVQRRHCSNPFWPGLRTGIDNSMWSSGIIWRHIPWSAFVQVMNSCLLAPSHYPQFSEIWIKIQQFYTRKMHSEVSSAKWRPFSSGVNVLIKDQPIISRTRLPHLWLMRFLFRSQWHTHASFLVYKIPWHLLGTMPISPQNY